MSQRDDETKSSAEFLRRGLALGEGFGLYVVSAEQLETREQLVRFLGEDPALALAVVDVAELEDAGIDRSIEVGLRELPADRRRVVVVTGLEELAERVPDVMVRLNEHRNELRARVDGALVLLGDPSLLQRVQHQAPDVWSTRAADLELDEVSPSWRPPPLLPRAGSGATEGLSQWQHELQGMPRGDPRGRLASRMAEVLEREGVQEARARALYEQAAQEQDDPGARALALVHAANLGESELGDEATAATAAAVQQLDDDGIEPGLAARAWSGLAHMWRARGLFDEAQEAVGNALRLLERSDDDEVRAEVLAEHAELLASRGHPSEALEAWEQALSLPQPSVARLRALVRAGTTAALAGRRNRLARYWREYLARGGRRQQLDAELDALPSAAASLAREIVASPQRSGEVIVASRGGVELVRIPAGRFLMGSPPDEPGHRPSEGPRHEVELSSFYLGRTPVTNEQYGEFLRANPEVEPPRFWHDRRFNQPRQPVVGVSWDDAHAYCEWAGLSLPTEAQWEYACRAGTTTRYWSGDDEDDLARVAWYGEDPATGCTHPVGGKDPNPFGLYDMHGNVYEWCEDTWTAGYEGAVHRRGDGLLVEPVGLSSRIIRGGSWVMPALGARSAYRYGRPPSHRSFALGFRPAQSIG